MGLKGMRQPYPQEGRRWGLDGTEMELSWCEEPGVGLDWARMFRGGASVGSGVELGYLE